MLSHLDIEGVAGAETIVSTPEHPFWVKDKGWVPVASLNKGDILSDLDGNDVLLNSITVVHKPQVAYNLEVDIAHTYAVGQNQVWVHNSCARKPNKPHFSNESQAKKQAKKLGYKEDKQASIEAKSKVYTNKKAPSEVRHISRDIDGHIGGAFKGASKPGDLSSKSTRSGTYDHNLNYIGK